MTQKKKKMESGQQLGGGKKRVVVIGGGIGGSLIANSLQFDADLTLVDPYALPLLLLYPSYYCILRLLNFGLNYLQLHNQPMRLKCVILAIFMNDYNTVGKGNGKGKGQVSSCSLCTLVLLGILCLS